jgi:hypothetical protein
MDVFASDGTTAKFHIKGDGSVGIGTNTPAGKMHVKAGSTLADTVILERTGLTSNIAYTSLRSTATKTTDMGDGFGSLVSFAIQDNAGVVETIGSIGAVRAGTDTTGDIVFQPLTSGTANERMRIKYNGNVGIGTTTPTAKLDVAGDIVTTGAGTAQSTIVRGLAVNTGLVAGATGSFVAKGSVDQNLLITDTTNDVVGIGGTPNANAKLDIQSTTKAFMPPRMTTTQKNAISSPTAGMVVYDSTLSKLCVYTTAWETITSA